MAYRTIIRGSKPYKETISFLKGKKFSLFCGSAVSLFPPTNLQNGLAIVYHIVDELCNICGLNQPYRKILYSSAFELILSKYPKPEMLRKILSEYFSGASHPGGIISPNSTHDVIAGLCCQGVIRSIITTNYDDCIERSLARFGSRITPIFDRDPAGCLESKFDHNVAEEKVTLFKVHGCVSERQSLIFEISQEKSMSPEKKKIFHLLSSNTLVVVGYSGMDFEICPVIYEAHPRNLIWIARPSRSNGRNPELTRNAKKLLSHVDGAVVVVADLRHFLGDVSSKEDVPVSGSSSRYISISDKLFDPLSDADRRLWAARLFAELGMPLALHKVVMMEAAHSSELSYEWQLLQSSGFSHQGLYSEVADFNGRMAKDQRLHASVRAMHFISESGAASMAGDAQRALAALNNSKALLAELDDPIERQLSLLGIDWMTLLVHRAKLTGRTNREPNFDRLASKFRQLRDRAIGAGQYGLAGLCAAEIKNLIGDDASLSEAPELHRDDIDIFAQLGSFLGQATAQRDKLGRSRTIKDAKTLRKMLPLLRLLDLRPEVWRTSLALLAYETEKLKREKLANDARKYLNLCEFDMLYKTKILKLIQAAENLN